MQFMGKIEENKRKTEKSQENLGKTKGKRIKVRKTRKIWEKLDEKFSGGCLMELKRNREEILRIIVEETSRTELVPVFFFLLLLLSFP